MQIIPKLIFNNLFVTLPSMKHSTSWNCAYLVEVVIFLHSYIALLKLVGPSLA